MHLPKFFHHSALLIALAAALLSGCAGPQRSASKPINGMYSGAPNTTASDDEDHADPLRALSNKRTSSRPVAAIEPPKDLWERMRRGFVMPDLQNDLVTTHERWYATRPEYMFRMTERSRKYMFHIIEELEVRNMPTELALLPFVESAFNPQAVSSAKAAGMWQFMPATGKSFALKQNIFRDDRRDVLASTRAALDYLQKLHGMFGDWHLALAAYNWGEGSVSRAIAKNQRAGLGTSYTDLNMPQETRNYVPKLQAIKNLVANPQAFNVSLPSIENHPYFQAVDITRDIDVAVAAKLAGVQLDDFKALNPSAHRPVILATGTPQVLLPWDNAAIFQKNLQAQGNNQLASWTAWVAPTTTKPRDAAKAVGMDEAELRQVNNITGSVVIKAGSTLLVRRAAHKTQDVALSIADNAQIALAPDIVLRRALVKARKNDTVASIAKRYQVAPARVAEWNKVAASSRFKTGQSVVLLLPIKPGTTATTRVAKADSVKPSKAKRSSHNASPKRLANAHGKDKKVQLAKR